MWYRITFLPDDSTYIGDCKDCKYHEGGSVSNCCYGDACDPISGTNFWHHKDYDTYEEWIENKKKSV